MRLQGQRSTTGLKLALVLFAVLGVAAVVYLMDLVPR
jgi:hypothetical protein